MSDKFRPRQGWQAKPADSKGIPKVEPIERNKPPKAKHVEKHLVEALQPRG